MSNLLSRLIKKRNPRRKKTQWYMVDLPRPVVKFLKKHREEFIRTFGRDYEDLDPQFWYPDKTDKPVPAPGMDEFIESLVKAMETSRHHPAHVYAVKRTHRVIYDGNFADVPDAWTQEWEAAVKSYESWDPNKGKPMIETPHGGW